MDLCTAFLVIVVLICVLYYSYRRARFSIINTTSCVKSDIDGQCYRVHREHMEDAVSAADMLAKINRRNIKLLRHLKKKYITGSPLPGENHERMLSTKRLLRNYNPDRIFENSPKDITGDTSYTINKGTTIALCLRHKNPVNESGKKLYKLDELNTLMFVDLHELSHVATLEEDHPLSFWRTFKFILEEAVEIGIYTPVNYSIAPVHYCGIDVSSSPLFDTRLSSI
jgi:hypothetical protein